MATDKNVNQQTQDSTPTTDDYLLAWDNSSGASRKVAISDILLLSNPYKFSAYRTGNQAVGTGLFVKVQLNAENFDTNNNFDSTVAFRWTVPVTGFYYVNGRSQNNGAGNLLVAYIFKNGVLLRDGTQADPDISNGGSNVGDLLSLTAGDYLELYIYSDNGTIIGTADATYFSGFLVSKA